MIVTITADAHPDRAWLGAIAVALVLLVAPAANAVTPPPFSLAGFAPVRASAMDPHLAISTSRSDADDGIVHGRLLGTKLRVGHGRLTLEAAIADFGDAVGIRTLVAFAGSRADLGRTIDLETLASNDDPIPALQLLERMIAQALDDDGAWQVIGGRLEVGPKSTLARDEARRREVLEMEFLRDRFDGIGQTLGVAGTRKTPEVGGAELIEHITTSIEPEAWLPEPAVAEHLRWRGEDENPLARTGRYASISWRFGVLLITAPEFVLHRIRGPRVVVPPAEFAESARTLANPRLGNEPATAEVTNLRFEPSSSRRRATAAPDPALVDLGKLYHARLRVVLDDVPLRTAVEAIGRACDVSIDTRWGPGGDDGIDPEQRITIAVSEIGGLEALELALGLARDFSRPTWQLQGGFVEVGPRNWLARRTAQRTAVYETADLQFEPPYFASGGAGGPGGGGIERIVTPLEQRHGVRLGMSTRSGVRKSAAFLAAELLLDIERHLEPRAWVTPMADDPSPVASRRWPEDPLNPRGVWASASYRGGRIALTAPDFVHRRINGYPPLPSPAGRR